MKKIINKTKISKSIIILIVIFAVIGIGLLINNKNNRSKKQVDIRMPVDYSQPLVIANFGSIFSIQPVNAKESKVVQESSNKIRYMDTYQNTDVIQTKYSHKLKEDIVLKQSGHPDRFEYKINVDEYDFKKSDIGDFIFYKKGHLGDDLYKMFVIPAPYMIDADGARSLTSDVEINLTEDGLLTLVPNQEWLKNHKYPVVLDPTVEINILNLYSHPQQGDNWEVEFTTKGQADLKIIPNDQATIDDDEFTGLYCDEQERVPEILEGDIIYYPNWQCNGVGKVVHYTVKAGHHTLRFEFGDQVVYAYNNAGDAWWNTDWSYRMELTVDNTANSNTLTEYQIFVELDDSYTDFWSNVDWDGDDVRFTNQDGTVEYKYFQLYFNTTTDEAIYWVKTDSLAANSNVPVYIYYGNPSATAVSSAEDTFSYTTRQERAVLLGDYNDGGSYMIPFFDNTSYGIGVTTITQESSNASTAVRYTFASGVLSEAGTVASSTKPIAISGNVASGDLWVPFAWQATSTIVSNYGGTGELEVYNVTNSSAQVNVVDDGVINSAFNLSARSVNDTSYGTIASYSHILVTSTVPILAYMEVGGNRIIPAHPAAKEWWGHARNTRILGNGEDNNQLAEMYCHTGSSQSNANLDAYGVWTATTACNGTYGTSAAYASSTKSIFVFANADGNGSDSQIWYSKKDLDTVYISPDNYAYMSCTTPYANTTATIYTISGGAWTQATTATFTRSGSGVSPYYWKDGTARSGGVKIEANNPIYCYVDRTTSNDESNIPNRVINRKGTWPEPEISNIGSQEVPANIPNPTWNTGTADFKIYESSSLTWDAGTLVCSGTLTDNYNSTINCDSDYISPSTQYRVQVVLKDVGSVGLNMNGAGDYVDHKNIKGGWAGTNPTLGTCGFNDIGADNGATICNVAYNSNDVRITNTGGGNVIIGASAGSEGFMYLITTDNDIAKDATSYMDSSIDSYTEDSSKVQIYTAPDLQQQHYRWRYDNGSEIGWMDANWNYRKKVSLSGSAGAGTNYQVKLIVNYSSGGDFSCDSHCDTAFDDIRFTNSKGTTTLDYWREDYSSSDTATFWVEVQDNLDSNQDIYVYYGNSNANTTSNATNTALFWDDFDGTSLDTTSRWDTSSGNPPTTYSVHDGYLSMWGDWGSFCSGNGVYNRLNTQQSFTIPIAVETRFSASGTATIGNTNICYHTILGNRDAVGISGGSTYGNVFRINSSYTGFTETLPAKDTWYRISKYYETNQLRAITSYGIDNTYSGSVLSSGVLGLAGDTDNSSEAGMADRVDWIFVRKYIYPEPDFSTVGSEESYPGSVTKATFIFDEDIGLANLETASTSRLRFLVSNEGGYSTTTAYQLEVAKTTDCSAGSYSAVPTDSSGDWKIQASNYISNNGDSTLNIEDQSLNDALTDPISGSIDFVNGELRDDNNMTSDITLSDTEFTEIEFAIQAVSGNAEGGAQYCFRLVGDGLPTNFTYNSYATSTIFLNPNTAPTVTSVTDTPDSIGIGAKLNFSVDWNDADTGEMVKAVICKGSGITTSTTVCKDGEWARSNIYTNRDPESEVYYTTSVSDAGTNNYWAFICDDSADTSTGCSAGTAGTFTVTNQRPDEPTNLLIEGMEVGLATNLTDTTPEFKVKYKDTNDEGDVAVNYCIQVNTQADFAGTDMWVSDSASCYTGSAIGSNVTANSYTPEFSYNGSALAMDGTIYYWRVWLWDGEERSVTSTTGWFNMAANASGGGVRVQGGRFRGGVRLQ